MPSRGDSGEFVPLPSTLKRSPKKAQDTYEKTLESAEKTYEGDEQAAHRAAWAAVKHSFEKTGDHWATKAQRGPSDPRAEQQGPGASRPTKAALTSKAEPRSSSARKRAMWVPT